MTVLRRPRPAAPAAVVARSVAVIAVAVATVSTPAASAAGGPVTDATVFRTLSNERTSTRWANAEYVTTVRRSPSTLARAVGRLQLDTEDGRPEVYLALQSAEDPVNGSWVKVRLPARPNGQTGWVPREALGPLHRTTLAMTIDRRTLRATLRRAGRTVWSSRVGVGKSRTPTPAGRFYVRERLVPKPGTIYGAVAFGTSAYASVSDWPGGGVVGIHGTDQPELIPGRPSHGCVRIRPDDLRRLDRLLRIGTPVRIV